MLDLEKTAEKDFHILIRDFTHHTVYTFFIIIVSSIITYFLLGKLINKKMDTISLKQKSKTTVIVPQPKEELYVEKGSPYDNRTVNNESNKVIFHGPRDKKRVALTFDAEMTDYMKAQYQSGKVKSSYDKRIIDTLNQTQTKATLFLTGMWIELYPQVTKELASNTLFEVGSHSYTDSSYHGFCFGLKQIPSTLAIEEIGATAKLLRQHAGIDNKLFRFPGGCYTPDDVKLVNQAGNTVVHWDVVGADGFNANTKQIVHNVIDNVQNGSIVVLHMNGEPTAPKTAEALPDIISGLKTKGFEFVKVNELLGLPVEAKTQQ